MIDSIGLFYDEKTKKEILMEQLTDNNIILCNNYDLKNRICNEFIKLEEEDEPEEKLYIETFFMYQPTTVFKVNKHQTFIFTTELSSVLMCKNPYDLWFCDEKDGEIDLYPLTCFKKYDETWRRGLLHLYKEVGCGRFGCYEGYGR